MKIAIMQPYFFPYIGYYQLISAVDNFVVYDDVTYIKSWWINRNRILLNGKDIFFTVPIKNASSFISIDQTEIASNLYEPWKKKFLKTLVQAYAKAPLFNVVYNLIESVINKPYLTINELATDSLVATCNYLEINTGFQSSTGKYNNTDLKSQERIIDICRREDAGTYINPIGGKKLYDKKSFAEAGLKLYFINSRILNYRQLNHEFVPYLSIIDVMMFNSVDQIQYFLKQYELE